MKNNVVRIGLGISLLAGCAEVTSGPQPGTTARVRVAHLSPDAPAVDFCLAAAGSGEFGRPVLAGAGGITGLSYGRVTRYLDVPAGQYDVRLVAPNAADCASSLGGLPDITDLPELTAGASATIAAIGKLAHGDDDEFQLRAYIDDATVGENEAKLRFIHASPGTPNVDVGIGGGAFFKPVFANVEYGGFQAHDNGYVTTAPFDGIEISARATGATADVIAIKPASLPAGAIATAFAIGQIGNAQAPLEVLLCTDTVEHDLETECAQVGGEPERARVRIAHLSPDAPAVDVCLATSGGTFEAPFLATLGGRQGLAYSQVTAYVELPIASYDVRVIAATDTTCDNAVVPDTTGIALAKDLVATVAAIGDLERSGASIADPGFRLAVFVDSADVAANKTKLRFVHASPGTPNVDVGLNSGASFLRLFGNVEFGKVAAHGGIDSLGYLETNPLTSQVSARATGAHSDAIIVNGVTLAAGTIATAFAIGNKTGQATNPLRVLLCNDTALTGTLLSQCVVTP
jgi:hypothetical protein